MVKEKNPAFANFLMDVSNSSASCLITQIPQVYGLLLDDNSRSLNMRLRSYIWPDNLPHNLKCQCGQSVTPTHLNCNRCISFRSKVHDSVRDQLYCMCKSYGIVSFLEPVLAGLFDDTDVDKSFGNSRGDVIFPGLDGSFIIADVMSIDVCNDSNKKLAKSNAKNPLLIGEKFKMQKYCAKLKLLNSASHSNYLLYPFVFSLYSSLGESATSLLEIFVKIVKEKTSRTFDLRFWKNESCLLSLKVW
ncbi:hypothetical protein GEMRC1_010511 [Eukaryota sp. GEM-RC1]